MTDIYDLPKTLRENDLNIYDLPSALRGKVRRSRRPTRTQDMYAHRRRPRAVVGDALVSLGEAFGGRHPDPPPATPQP